MANDFDNDDLSWMRDQNSDDDWTDDELPDFDWVSDDDDSGDTDNPSSGPSTGLTGQLPWQREREDERSGLTGELDWQSTDDPYTGGQRTASEQEIESAFDTMDSADSDPADLPADEPVDDLEASDQWMSALSDWDTEIDDEFSIEPQANLTDSGDLEDDDLALDDDLGADDNVPDWLSGLMTDEHKPDIQAPAAGAAGAPDPFDFADEEHDIAEAPVQADSSTLPDWLQSVAPPEAGKATPADLDMDLLTDDLADADDDSGFAGLFDDLDFGADADTGDDELIFEDTPGPASAFDADLADDADDEEYDLFAAISRTQAESDRLDDLDDELTEPGPPEIFSPEALQGFDDYSLLGALDAPDGTGSGDTVSDNFFDTLLDDIEDHADADQPFEFDFDAVPSAEDAAPQRSLLAPDDDDDDSLQWMNDLEAMDDLAKAPVSSADLDEVDDFLASLGDFDDVPAVDHELMVSGDDIDFNRLLSDPAFADFEANPAESAQPADTRTPVPDGPEWLSDVSIREVSASALVRQQQDQPLESLPDRLQALREEGLNLPAAESVELAAPVTGIDPASAPAAVPGEGGQYALSPEQAAKVAALKAITGRDEAASAAPVRTGRMQPTAMIIRLLAALLIGGAVILPFVSNIRIGNLPPAAFADDSRSDAIFDVVDDLQPRELVLIAAEYDGANAGELDGLADVLLRHTILRGGIPVVVSTNPVGLLRMDKRLEEISNGFLIRNEHYHIGRLIAGQDIGLRNLVQQIGSITASDVTGNRTGLNLNSLNDFAAIIVITDELRSIRGWSEQVAPLTRAPVLFATSMSVSPLAEPYADAVGIGGLLVGYRDAYTYASQINALIDDGATPPLIDFGTATPTPEITAPVGTAEPTEEAEIGATGEVTPDPEQPTAEVSPEVDQTAQADETTEPVATQTPDSAAATSTPTETPTDAATGAPTETPEPGPTLTPTPEIDATDDGIPPVFGTVISQEPVNVRSGPGTGFPPVGVMQPGERFEVVGESEDGTWVNVQLGNATRGWVFAQLVRIESPTSGLPSQELPSQQVAINIPALGGLGMPVSGPVLMQMQPRATATRTASPTEQATTETAGEPDAEGGSSAAADSADTSAFDLRVEIPYQDERWYGTTLGILAIIVIIVIGNIISLLTRRTRQGLQRPSRRD